MPNIPKQFTDLAESAELYDQSEAVGNKFNLHIDQIGELDAEIRDILNGASDSKDFTKHIIERLEIDKKTADAIAEEVNKVVFQTLRDRIREQGFINNPQAPDFSTLEKAGDFTVEKSTDQSADQGLRHIEDPEEVIAGIEDPVPMNPDMAIPAKPGAHTDLLVDHLLSGPIVAKEEKTEEKVPAAPPPRPAQAPEKPRKQDLYREPIE